MVLAAVPHIADPTTSTHRADRCGRTPMCRRARLLTRVKPWRFSSAAPGFRDVVVAVRSVPPLVGQHNANLVGGDIGVGGNTLFTRRPDTTAQPVDHAIRRSTCARRRPPTAAHAACRSAAPLCCVASSASSCQPSRDGPRRAVVGAFRRRHVELAAGITGVECEYVWRRTERWIDCRWPRPPAPA